VKEIDESSLIEARKKHAEYMKKYYAKKREDPEQAAIIKQRRRDQYLKYKEREAKTMREYYAKNRDHLKEKAALRHHSKRDSILEQRKASYEKNKEVVLDRCKKYRQTPAGKLVQSRGGHTRRAKLKAAHSCPFTPIEWQSRLDVFSNCCAYCNSEFTEQNSLHIDHFLPLSYGGSHTIGNLLPACSRCNHSKLDRDPYTWFASQSFFTTKKWKAILVVLGKTQKNYNQIPLI
jgi:5-methylcytosine-specific restriction endonuclease McrA